MTDDADNDPLELPDRGPVHAALLEAYEEAIGEWDFVDADDGGDGVPIDVVGIEFNFSEDDDEDDDEGGRDDGWVLITKGMSAALMKLDDEALALEGEERPARRIELLWYVREADDDLVATLRWLAQLPAIDQTWLGFGHRVQMPEPPVAGSSFRNFLFLPPVVRSHREMLEDIEIDGETPEVFCVHLISDAELDLIQDKGVDAFLDLMDGKAYPLVLDPGRRSLV